MSGDIDIQVRGSSGSCRAAADWFRSLADQAVSASNSATTGLQSANAGWWGPASASFQSAVTDPRDAVDDLQHTAATAERALRDFADGLDKVVEKMDAAVDTATAGDLKVTATAIVAPVRDEIITVPKPTPDQAASPGGAERYLQAAGVYNAQVKEYNAKREVFNQCSLQVKEARILEDDTHGALLAELPIKAPDAAGSGGDPYEGWNVGKTSVSAVLDGIGAQDSGRAAVLDRGVQLYRQAEFFDRLATSPSYDALRPGPSELNWLRKSAEQAGLNRPRVEALLRAYEKGPHGREPFTSTKWVALGTEARKIRALSSRSGLKSSKFTRAVGIASGVLIVADEGAKWLRGEQSLGGSIAKSVGMIGGGLIGGALGAIGGSAGTPFAAGVAAFTGNAIGQEAGNAVVNGLAPREFDQPFNQPWLEHAESYVPPYVPGPAPTR